MQHMVENLFGTLGTLFSSKPAIFHPCGSLPLFLLSFPQLSSPEEVYFRPILFLCDNCPSKFSNEEYLTTHTVDSLQRLKCNEFEPMKFEPVKYETFKTMNNDTYVWANI